MISNFRVYSVLLNNPHTLEPQYNENDKSGNTSACF